MEANKINAGVARYRARIKTRVRMQRALKKRFTFLFVAFSTKKGASVMSRNAIDADGLVVNWLGHQIWIGWEDLADEKKALAVIAARLCLESANMK